MQGSVLAYLEVIGSPMGLGVGAVVLVGLIVALTRKSGSKDEKVIAAHVSEGRFEEAASHALAIGKRKQAFNLFLRAKMPTRAAEVALLLDDPRKAAELFRRAKEYDKAAKAYRAAGLDAQAARLEARGQKSTGSDASRSNTPRPLMSSLPPEGATAAGAMWEAQEAVERFREAKDAHANTEELRRLAEVAGQNMLAAGDIRGAANIFEEAGLIDAAANLYMNLLGEPAVAAGMLAQHGNHRRAAELYQVAGQSQRALDEWNNWAEAAERPFEFFANVNRLGDEMAMSFLRSTLKRHPVDKKNADIHEEGIALMQVLGENDAALTFAKAFLAIVPEHDGIKSHLTRLSKKRSTTTPGELEIRAPAAQPVENSEIEAMLREYAQEFSYPNEPIRRTRNQPARDSSGIDPGEVELRWAIDESVMRARTGPTPESLRRAIAGEPVGDGTVDRYYRLGLALTAHGRWEEAHQVFESIDSSPVSFADAKERANELGEWRAALTKHGNNRGYVGGRYRILGELGRGGMAIVYRAQDEMLGREVAVKFTSKALGHDSNVGKFFEREARASASLNHPNIVTVHDYGMHDGQPFMALELVVGVTVEQILDATCPIAVVDALRIATQVLSALEFAHESAIVHRDVKPANFMCTEGGLTKLMDFGLARSIDQKRRTSIVAGTPQYMAPEQIDGVNNDPRIDLFALGVSLFEMLSGKLPFDGLNRSRAPRRLREINPKVPAVLCDVVMKAIECNPDERFQTASEMLIPLRSILARTSEFLGEQGLTMESIPPLANSMEPARGVGTAVTVPKVEAQERLRDLVKLATEPDVQHKKR